MNLLRSIWPPKARAHLLQVEERAAPSSTSISWSVRVARLDLLSALLFPSMAYVWILRLLSSVPFLAAKTPERAVQNAGNDSSEPKALTHTGLAVATKVGLGLRTYKTVCEPFIHLRRLTPSIQEDSQGADPSQSITVHALEDTGSPASLNPSVEDVPPSSDSEVSITPPVNDCGLPDTFTFAGLNDSPNLEPDVELQGFEWPPHQDGAFSAPVSSPSLKTWSHVALPLPSHFNISPATSSAGGYSSGRTFSPVDSDRISLSSHASSIASSAYSIYSRVSSQTVASCSSLSWSSFRRSLGPSPALPADDVRSDQNASGYVEAEYIAGCEPAEPEHLHHGDQTYIIRGIRGSGSFGKVMLANRGDGAVVAVKVVHKDKQYRAPDGRKNLVLEKTILASVAQVGNPYIVRLKESWADELNVYFVMPYYPDTLLDLIIRRSLSRREVKLYAAELVSGLASLHGAGIIHRDLKHENILISRSGHVAIADFGLATVVDTSAGGTTTGAAGTCGYMAPEVYYCEAHGVAEEKRMYTAKCDVWSLAVIILEMAIRHVGYFIDESESGVDMAWERRVPYDKVPEIQLRHLLNAMLNSNTSKRPSSEDLKSFKYFSQYDFEALERGKLPEASWSPIPPPFATWDGERWASIRFSSFHNGMDSPADDEEYVVDENHCVVPTKWVAVQREQDVRYPDVFEFVASDQNVEG